MRRTIFLLMLIFFFVSHGKAMEKNRPVWEVQIREVMNKQGLKGMDGQTLQLKGYTYRGKLDTQAKIDSIKVELFGDDAIKLSYLGLWKDGFALLSLKVTRDHYRECQVAFPIDQVREEFESTHIFSLAFCLGMNVDIIDLEWAYGGKAYRSVALASATKGIVYDNIGHYLIDQVEEVDKTFAWDTDAGLSLQSQLAGAEANDEEYTDVEMQSSLPANRLLEGNTTVVTTRKKKIYKNLWGEALYGYHLICHSVFDKQGILIGWETVSKSFSCAGYSCDAALENVVLNPRYHEFSWAYSMGEGAGSAVQWTGERFDISGMEHGTGTLVHRIRIE